jgi:hypothetical protein
LLVGLFAVVFALVSVLASAPPAFAANAQVMAFGHNLIVNGDAEANVGSDDETIVVKPIGWTTSGQFGVFKYGGIFGFPDRRVPGPPNRGRNFFTGGDAAVSSATQIVDVRRASSAIDAGTVHFTLSAWLGGYDGQDDYATVSAAFLDTHARELGHVRLGPVTPADRHALTGLVQRFATGKLPPQTRAVRVVLTAKRVVGTSNDGYIDDVSFLLSRST